MLRITTVASTNPQVSLLLEGRLAGAWVSELRDVCDNLLSDGRIVQLDLAGVSFLEVEGIEELSTLRVKGVTLTNCSPFITEQLKSGERSASH